MRKRPAVIFGSDGLEGCEHSVFEILSNSIDEAREGFGSSIIVTKYLDGSIQVEDFGRGIPVDYNQNEQRYNWELVFCELYAGGKYQNDTGDNYEFSLGLNGLGLCATQYASEYMEVEIHRDKQKYTLRFEKGENISFEKQPYRYKTTGTRIHWRPDLEVFTDISIPVEYYQDVLRRQAIVNKGLVFTLKVQTQEGFTSQDFLYQDGITDYVKEVLGDQGLTGVQYWETERTGREPGGQKGLPGKAQRGGGLLQPGEAAGILSQFLLAGTRRQPGTGRCARLLSASWTATASRTASTTKTKARSPLPTWRSAWCW